MRNSWKVWCVFSLLVVALSSCDRKLPDLDGIREHGSTGNLSVTVNGVTFNMIHVSGGSFDMGVTPEQNDDGMLNADIAPVHEVFLNDYYIGETEVTQALWVAVMGENPSVYKYYSYSDNMPVENVSWDDCQEFLRRLSELLGAEFTLPTEAQWEYAARGGQQSNGYKYSGSNNVDDVAWIWTNCSVRLHEVATKSPNELGIYDMSGNVSEWCQDWYDENYYNNSPLNNPQGPSEGDSRILRGGNWHNYEWYARTSHRMCLNPFNTEDDNGLRIVLE